MAVPPLLRLDIVDPVRGAGGDAAAAAGDDEDEDDGDGVLPPLPPGRVWGFRTAGDDCPWLPAAERAGLTGPKAPPPPPLFTPTMLGCLSVFGVGFGRFSRPDCVLAYPAAVVADCERSVVGSVPPPLLLVARKSGRSRAGAGSECRRDAIPREEKAPPPPLLLLVGGGRLLTPGRAPPLGTFVCGVVGGGDSVSNIFLFFLSAAAGVVAVVEGDDDGGSGGTRAVKRGDRLVLLLLTSLHRLPSLAAAAAVEAAGVLVGAIVPTRSRK